MQSSEMKQLRVGDTVGYDSPYKVQASGRPMFTCHLGVVIGLTWKYVQVLWIAEATDLSQSINPDGLYTWKLNRGSDYPNILALD
jgi:hypothetical protein